MIAIGKKKDCPKEDEFWGSAKNESTKEDEFLPDANAVRKYPLPICLMIQDYGCEVGLESCSDPVSYLFVSLFYSQT